MRRFVAIFVLVLCVAAFGAENPFKTILGDTLVDMNGKEVSFAALEGKIVGVYFSAHWCPPCQKFSPALVRFRAKKLEEGKKFEIVFVSLDHHAKAMKDYMQAVQMPWPAVPFEKGRAIAEKFHVNAIPTLIIFDPYGNIISRDGRAEVSENPKKAFIDWEEKAKKLEKKAEDEAKK